MTAPRAPSGATRFDNWQETAYMKDDVGVGCDRESNWRGGHKAVTDDRNYVAEAVAIANGESALLAQQEHLVALVAQIAGRDSNLRCVVKLLTAIMADNGLSEMRVTPELLKLAEQGLTTLEIKAEADGGVTVTRRVLPQASAAN